MCATELFVIRACVLNCKTSLQRIHQENLIQTKTHVFHQKPTETYHPYNLETVTTLLVITISLLLL